MSQPKLSSHPRSRRFGGPPPRLAFVVDWLEDSYQGEVLAGAVDAATVRGANLVVVPGGILGGSGRNGAYRNQLYDLLNPRSYDGLIVMTGTLGNQLGEDVVNRLCADFPKDRVCSVAIALRESPSVLIDNRSGQQAAIEHLIRDHKHSKIAFIRGPTANMEAEERYWAYKDVLEAHNLPFDERLVVMGDFHRPSGGDAVATLFDERGLKVEDIDAIAAAGDLMALGALDELKERGLRVPEDIALTGFDDIDDARHANPPLSTVSQPFKEQGREAVRAVLHAVAGKPETGPLLVSTTDHFRRSCGCIPDDDALVTERPPMSGSLDIEAALVRQRSLILAQLTRTARGNVPSAGRGWENKIYNALHDEMKGQYGTFRAVFSDLMERIFDSDGDVAVGHSIISGLRRELVIAAGNDAAKLRQIESLLHDARVIASEVIERSQATRRIMTARWARILNDVSTRLITSFEMVKLADTISEQLPRLGINSCYVCRYSPTEHDNAELLLGFGPWGKVDPNEPPTIFPSTDLVPPNLLSRDQHIHLVVEPLATEDEQLGFVVFEHGEIEAYVYEVLRQLLTAALRGALLSTTED